MGIPVIVEAVRTPIGRKNGGLSGVHVSKLLGHAQKAVLDRAGVDPASVGQVIGGCVTQIGEQSFNVTRTAWLSAGLPYEIGATTIDCQCGSSQHSNHFAHNLIAAGVVETAIACGVEGMSRVGIGANTNNGPGEVKPPDFPYDLPNRFVAAERIAKKYGISRQDADAFGYRSNQRALQAIAAGHYDREIVPLRVTGLPDDDTITRLVARDEGPRETSLERLATLKSAIPDGIHTPGSICQISDGASAVLWMDEKAARRHGLEPRARLVAQVLIGSDPYFHIEGPIDATAAVLKQAGMSVADIDIFEINEAFASVVLGWARTYDADMTKVNVNGGAIALGHPMGATGCRLFTSALHELERSGRSTALIAMCCGGAVATASIIARV
jgi:acetyl-CoA C-acetyltransferase